MSLDTGSQFFRVPGDPVLHDDNQQGFQLFYLQNTPLQTSYQDLFGRFGDGWLISINRIAGFRIGKRMTLSLQAFDTSWRGPQLEVQWLERAALIVDINRSTSFTIGLRRIVGTAPPFPGQPLPVTTDTTNVSFSLAHQSARNDVYLVYGDPNAPFTQNTIILKLVHYFGADKGT